jgi:hypothetical protein
VAAKREKLVSMGLLVDLTPDEWYELAQSADVAGRSIGHSIEQHAVGAFWLLYYPFRARDLTVADRTPTS